MSAVLAPGFSDAVAQSQQVFRAALQALARPGQRQFLPVVPAVDELAPGLAALLLTLTDDTTPVWWQPVGDVSARATARAAWLRFHTGAPTVAEPQRAAFAVITEPLGMPALEAFAAGSAAAPEFSTTLLIDVPSFARGPQLAWHGPGIADRAQVAIDGLPAAFWAQWQANHAAFPQGVDVLFASGDELLGLPRTTRVRRLERV